MTNLAGISADNYTHTTIDCRLLWLTLYYNTLLFFLEADAPFLIVLNMTVMYFDLPRLSTLSNSLSHPKLERPHVCFLVFPGFLSNLLMKHGHKY